MDILFKNSFILTEKLILECRVAFISKWDKFFHYYSYLHHYLVLFIQKVI